MKSNSLCNLKKFVQSIIKSIMICVLSVVVVLFFFRPMQSRAESKIIAKGEYEYGFYWRIYDDGRMIIDGRKTLDDDKIPLFTVNLSDDLKNSVKQVIVEGWVEIGNRAFLGFPSLTTVDAIRVTGIGELAFHKCTLLKVIKTGVDLKFIGKNAFNSCTSLEHYNGLGVCIDWIGEYAFFKCTNLIDVDLDALKIGHEAFYECSSLKKAPVYSTTDIGLLAFKGCSSLNDIDLTNAVNIGKSAFSGCTSLENVYLLESSLTEINESVFNDCSNLRKVSFPNTLKSIGQYAFFRCKVLEEATYNGDLSELSIDEKNENLSEIIKELGYKINYEVCITARVSDMPSQQVKRYNMPLELSSLVPSATGYRFIGWSKTLGGEVDYAPGDSYNDNSDLTLYAVWIKVYIIYYRSNTTWTVSDMPPQQEKKHDEPLTLSSLIPSRAEYQFRGWSKTSEGEVDYAPGDTYSDNSNITLYAVWTHGYIVNFDKNTTDTVVNMPSQQMKRNNEDLTIRFIVPSRTGYRFKGWSKTSGGEVDYVPGEQYSENSDLTLYAVWAENCHSCEGKGYIEVTCSKCNGAGGKILIKECKTCNNQGTVTSTCYSCYGKMIVVCTKCSGKGKITQTVKKTDICAYCGGVGSRIENNQIVRCSLCRGAGKFEYTESETTDCTTCGGSGTVNCSTCSGRGTIRTTCSVCGGSNYVSCPKTEKVTCTACNGCREQHTHSYGDGKVISAATCTSCGEKTFSCNICGATKTETIQATGHKVVTDEAVAATSSKTGLTEGSHCSVCGEVIKKQEVVPKLAKSGWVKESNVWYYYINGVKQTGWKQIGSKWYYFKKNGSMAANEWCGGYWLNKDGSWTYKKRASWKKDKVGWWYGDTSGWYAKKQWQKIDDKWYYFDTKGYIVTGTKTIGGKTYQFNSSGVCLNP